VRQVEALVKDMLAEERPDVAKIKSAKKFPIAMDS